MSVMTFLTHVKTPQIVCIQVVSLEALKIARQCRLRGFPSVNTKNRAQVNFVAFLKIKLSFSHIFHHEAKSISQYIISIYLMSFARGKREFFHQGY